GHSGRLVSLPRSRSGQRYARTMQTSAGEHSRRAADAHAPHPIWRSCARVTRLRSPRRVIPESEPRWFSWQDCNILLSATQYVTGAEGNVAGLGKKAFLGIRRMIMLPTRRRFMQAVTSAGFGAATVRRAKHDDGKAPTVEQLDRAAAQRVLQTDFVKTPVKI